MKPAKFDYLRPTNLQEALQLLEEYGEDAKIISGGQSLVPLLNMRLSTPKYLIDISRIENLKYIREEDDSIVIGALTKHAEVEKSNLIREKCGLLREAIQSVGHPQIRNLGTVCGSIAHADPSAELPCVISALRGEIVIASAEEERIVSPEEFFLTYLLTSLEPTEMVKEVRFPSLNKSAGYSFIELARRHGDFALVGAAAVIDLNDDGTISFARLTVGGASPIPCVLEEIEESLIGQEPSEELYKQASEQVTDYLEPDSDLHGSAEYRLQLSKVLTERTLNLATKRAKGGIHSDQGSN